MSQPFFPRALQRRYTSPGGHSTFFQVGVCGADFRSEKGACELKISKFGGLIAS